MAEKAYLGRKDQSLQAEQRGHSDADTATHTDSAQPIHRPEGLPAALTPAHLGRLQRTLGNHMTSLVLQRNKKKKKDATPTTSVWTPEHPQEAIQDCIIALWITLARDDQDLRRAQYMQTYSGSEGGWCDGWSYALSRGGDGLPEVWAEVDRVYPHGNRLPPTTAFEAVELARTAALYHVMNSGPPTDQTQLDAYKNAGYSLEQDPHDRETWRHEFGEPLELSVIREEIRGLKVDQTLRLTSNMHDGAVKRVKNGYIVSETERHGVQRCATLDQVMLILENWQKTCGTENFFSQTMVVG